MSDTVPLLEQFRDASVNLVTAPGNENSPISQHVFSPQFHYLQVHESHVNLLSTDPVSCPRPLRAIPAGDMLEGVVLPVTSFDAGKEISGFETYDAQDNSRFSTNPFLYWLNNLSVPDIGTSRVSPISPTPTSFDPETASDFSKALCPIKSDGLVENMIIPMIGYSLPSTEEESASMSKNAENEILPQSYTSVQQKPDEDGANSAEPNLKVMLSSREEARAQAAASRRLHRARVTEGIKALQNCVPCSDKRNRESALDDVIDYIKFLKLQLKALCQNRLSGEAILHPFVYLEGHGHYLLHQQMFGEPLEEMLGQLMISNMNAANELFGNKGLAILPMTLAYALLHSA